MFVKVFCTNDLVVAIDCVCIIHLVLHENLLSFLVLYASCTDFFLCSMNGRWHLVLHSYIKRICCIICHQPNFYASQGLHKNRCSVWTSEHRATYNVCEMDYGCVCKGLKAYFNYRFENWNSGFE
jgi:hypothetical protein